MLTSGVFGYLADYALWCVCFTSLLVHTWCFFKLFPRKRRPRLRLVLGNLLVFSSMLGAVALMAETYLRFLSVKTDAFGMTLAAQRWFVLYTDMNSLECRDAEWNMAKPEGVYRIAFVGDSFTYGWGIEREEDRFSDIIEKRLNAAANSLTALPSISLVEVLNVAKPGWGTGDEYEPICDMIEHYGVDEVVLCITPNDIEKLIPREAGNDPTAPPLPKLFNTESSPLVEYLFRRIHSPRVKTVRGYHDWLYEGYQDERVWAAQQTALGRIISLCGETGVTLRAVVLPFMKTGGTIYNAERVHQLYLAFLELNRVPAVSALPMLKGRKGDTLIVNRDDPHPNEKANALFADVIWQAFYQPAATTDE